jgi:protein-tyrosine phosphatase
MESIRARKISESDYNDFDYILAMDEDNLDLINNYAPANHSAKTGLFLSYAHTVKACKRTSVPDPYYGGDNGFTDVFDLVNRGCDSLLDYLLSGDEFVS